MAGLESLKRKAISKDGVSVAVKGPGLKRSWAEVKAWHHGAGSESLKRAQEKLLMKTQHSCPGRPQHFEDTSTKRQPSRTAAVGRMA